ncbi:MAG TPA: Hsp20/alpha crystallin family protein [Stellaceae bacterium]|nr:Hsp20/alpha crystallin family protein [Stellaceae bacterium]
MPPRDPTVWMWAEAQRMLERAERLQQRFFEPVRAGRQPVWEPPVDIFEVTGGLLIEIALPGVDPERLEIAYADGVLTVAGERPLPCAAEPAVIHRLEIPYGRFERRLALTAGHYELSRYQLTHGCLALSLRRVG